MIQEGEQSTNDVKDEITIYEYITFHYREAKMACLRYQGSMTDEEFTSKLHETLLAACDVLDRHKHKRSHLRQYIVEKFTY